MIAFSTFTPTPLPPSPDGKPSVVKEHSNFPRAMDRLKGIAKQAMVSAQKTVESARRTIETTYNQQPPPEPVRTENRSSRPVPQPRDAKKGLDEVFESSTDSTPTVAQIQQKQPNPSQPLPAAFQEPNQGTVLELFRTAQTNVFSGSMGETNLLSMSPTPAASAESAAPPSLDLLNMGGEGSWSAPQAPQQPQNLLFDLESSVMSTLLALPIICTDFCPSHSLFFF